jgi:hypothetical protein
MSFLHEALWPTNVMQSFWTGAGALWVFSAAVSAMDMPKPGDGRFYGWLYRFTHLLAANLDRALGPGSGMAISTEQQQTSIQNKENQ